MRVTNQMLVSNALNDLARTLARMSRTQEQLTTGRRIMRSSDDPVGTSRSMGYRADLSRLEQYQSNMGRGSAWLAQTDSSLGGVNDLVVRASAIALSQGTATATAATRAAAAAELDGLLDEAMLLANARFGERYVFAGDRTRTAPFVEAADGILYTGDSDGIREEIGPGQQIRINVAGLSAFASPVSGVNGSAISPSAMTDETTLAWLGITPGSVRIANGNETTVVDLSAATTIGEILETINESGARVLAELDAAGTGIKITNLLAGANLSISDVVPGSGATDLGIVGTSGPAGIFGMMIELKAALEADSTSRILQSKGGLDDASSDLLNQRATVGAKIMRLEMAGGRMDDQLIRLTQLLSDTEDADIARLATEYAMQQTAYQTALAVTGRVLQPSLLDFLR